MLEEIKTYASFIPIILAVVKFILDEKRLREKKRKDNMATYTKENGAYPPRKDKHRR
ncbi:hypothetical protein [Paenibacillus sp. FSL E2-0178]|uniref:hypothetical protein n=1 Tax=Paenibacillus sp. FSL E2-0178 TaxID=2921361 RepID=UPI0031583D02